MVQALRCKQVPALLEECCSTVPGAWSRSGALSSTLAQLDSGKQLQVHDFEAARFCHLGLHDLRLSDVPDLLEAHQSLVAGQVA